MHPSQQRVGGRSPILIVLSLLFVSSCWFLFTVEAAVQRNDENHKAFLSSLESDEEFRRLASSTTCNPQTVAVEANSDLLGFSVAMNADGNFALLGAPFDGAKGAAYVYTKSNSVWSRIQKLVSSQSPAELGQFGYSVALSADGSQLAIGEPNSFGDQGRVYYYNGSTANGYVLRQTLSGSGAGTTISHFGVSVALNNDILAVGGFIDGLESGYVWTYKKGADGTWSSTTNVPTGSGGGSAFFGWSLSLSKTDTLIVGSPGHSSTAGSSSVFRLNLGTGVWSQVGSSAAGNANSKFGFSVSTNHQGTMAVIGSPGEVTGVGRAWVYEIGSNQFTVEQQLSSTDVVGVAGFGSAVALSGYDASFALIGAAQDGGNLAGSAMLFRRVGDTWTQDSIRHLGSVSKQLGYSVALNQFATQAVLGAPFSSSSSAVILECDAPLPTSAPTQSPTTPKPSLAPSTSPSKSPTTSAPSQSPTTSRPSASPSTSPTTSHPSKSPSSSPTSSSPTGSPTTSTPTQSPTTSVPSLNPTRSPTTSVPTASPSAVPTTSKPTTSPSKAPQTSRPTDSPSKSPTTSSPSKVPSTAPSRSPTTSKPTEAPSTAPSRSPITSTPSFSPTGSPSLSPITSSPSVAPSSAPTWSKGNVPQCRPKVGMNKRQCDKLVKTCKGKRAPMKWVGTGCVINKQRQQDGGCQCVGFCGYRCAPACSKDRECKWVGGRCYHKVTGALGVDITGC